MLIAADDDVRKRLKVVLAAEEAAGVLALRWMAAHEGVELVAILTSMPGEAKRDPVVVDAARRLGCSLLPSAQVRDPALASWLRSEDVDLLINVHSLHVMNGDVVAVPRIGSFNLHPGPLPGYEGLNAPSWAIFNGEPCHAVTLHWMVAGVDTGAIAYDAWFSLDPNATGLSASLQCVRLGLSLIEALVGTALADPAAIPARPQERAQRRYYRRSEVPFDGKLDWHQSVASPRRVHPGGQLPPHALALGASCHAFRRNPPRDRRCSAYWAGVPSAARYAGGRRCGRSCGDCRRMARPAADPPGWEGEARRGVSSAGRPT